VALLSLLDRCRLSDRRTRWSRRPRTTKISSSSRSGLLDHLGARQRVLAAHDVGQQPLVTGTIPRRTVGSAAADLRAARGDLAAALDGRARLAAAGTHPFAAALGELNVGGRFTELGAQFASIARRQLVFGLHVHVAAVAAVVHALVTWLAQRACDGEELAVAPTWRIAENSFVADRDGLDAEFADLVSGEQEPVRQRLTA
jgi:gamma-glutamyl:cysteine ligase YbdK (ATP-grasp superfamily)